MKKVIIINNIISPLRVFLYNKLNKHFNSKGWKLKVIFLSETDKNRNWEKSAGIEFEYEVLNNFAIRTHEKDLNTFFINLKIINVLRRENPDKIICFGWDHFAAYAANQWARKNAKEFILWSGSTKYEKSWRRVVTKPLVRWLVKNSSGFIAYGTRAREYLIFLGADPEKIGIFYNPVDIDYFKDKSKEFDIRDRNKLKSKIGINTSKTIVFSGRLIEMKGVFDMLYGFKSYQQDDPDVSLLVMGKGPDKGKMVSIIHSERIKNVFFVDFIQYDDLYKYYSISNLLLFPSHQDIWGLVVNEAMACGLPVITTNETGASVDLVQEGKNGYIIKSNCPRCIAKGISSIFNNNLDKKNNSWDIVQKTRVEDNLMNLKI